MKKRAGEYLEKGDYHREVDKNWKYYPIYQAKVDFVRKFLAGIPKDVKILDAGCGEGILVEEFKGKGYDIVGMDLNYSSKHVKKGDITAMPFKDKEFDLVLCLDIIEHLNFHQQEKAVSEIKRVLKKDGRLLLTIPNLAHFASRISFLLTGKLLRTSEIERHPGDRPIKEYLSTLKRNGFRIKWRRGIFPTFPAISVLTYFFPSRVYPLHRILNRFLAYPNYSFLNVILCEKD